MPVRRHHGEARAGVVAMSLTILKVGRIGKRILAVLDGPTALTDHGTYRARPWAELRMCQPGYFPLAEFTFVHRDIQPEALEGWEVERV
jgi:hypothetical protein